MDNKYKSYALRVANPFPGSNLMLRRELEKVGGLSYYIDSDGIVHASGKIQPYVIVDTLRKAGINAVIWQVSGDDHMNKPLIYGNGHGYGYYYDGHGSYSFPNGYWHHHYPFYPYYY